MAKQITIKKAYVPIDFVDDDGNIIESFRFDKSDDAAQRIIDVQNSVSASFAKAENDEDYSLDKLHVDLGKAVDSLLGEGSYEKLYDMSPSWEIMLHYFVAICTSIAEETNTNLSEMNNAIDKYTKK